MLEDTAIRFGEEEFSLIDNGDYEVTLETIEQKVAQTGKKYLNLKMRIRRDVDQQFGGRVLFVKIWANDGDPVYNHSKINHIILTQKNTDNYKTEFKTFDDVLQYLHGLNFIVTVETIFNEYVGANENAVKDWSYRPSEAKSAALEAPASSNLDSIEIDDSEIPF